MSKINAAAKAFKALHVPGKPILLANVYDVTSARIIANMPQCKALATASAAIAWVHGTEDPKLTLKTQLATVADIVAVANEAGKPVSVDLQEGYGEELESAIKGMIDLGVVGINLEDSNRDGTMMEEKVAVERVKRAVAAAEKANVSDFVVNARSDSFLKGGTVDEAIRRGRLFLDAGATTVYILGGGAAGMSREDMMKIVRELDGKVNLALRLSKPTSESGSITLSELVDAGVSRVSVGPQIYLAAADAIKTAAMKVFG